MKYQHPTAFYQHPTYFMVWSWPYHKPFLHQNWNKHLKQEIWRCLLGKQTGTAQKLAGFRNQKSVHFLLNFVLLCACASSAHSLLFSNVCLLCLNQLLQHLWTAAVSPWLDDSTDSYNARWALFWQIFTSFLASNSWPNWLKHNTVGIRATL